MANNIVGAEGLTANPGLIDRQRNDVLLQQAIENAAREREFQAKYELEQRQMADAQMARQQQASLEAQRMSRADKANSLAQAWEQQKFDMGLKEAEKARQNELAKAQMGYAQNDKGLANAMEIARMENQTKWQITPYQQAELDLKKLDIEDRKPRRELAEKKADFAASTTLRKEFLDRPEVKDFIEIDQKVKAMDSLLDKAKTGDMKSLASIDQGIITIFNKVLDPDSVVRESEYARTPQNAPMLNAISGAIQKVQKGGAGLTLQDREALIIGAKIIAESNGQKFNQTLGEYEGLADAYQMDKDVVTRGLKPFVGYGNAQPQASFATEADADKANLPVGSIITIGGRRVQVT